MITLDQYFMGRRERCRAEFQPEFAVNAEQLLGRVNQLLRYYIHADHLTVRSGWRPPSVNCMVRGAAPTSHHMTGKAIDIGDDSREFSEWCVKNARILENMDLWMEAPTSTPSWVHLQSVPPKSGNRFFQP